MYMNTFLHQHYSRKSCHSDLRANVLKTTFFINITAIAYVVNDINVKNRPCALCPASVKKLFMKIVNIHSF